MDDYVIKQKIQAAYSEPKAPEQLVEKVILRGQAITKGMEAQKQLKTAPAEEMAELAASVLIGQLAAVSELPQGAQPEGLARQLMAEEAFTAALRGGNVVGRLNNGELLRQLAAPKPSAQQDTPAVSAPQNQGPIWNK